MESLLTVAMGLYLEDQWEVDQISSWFNFVTYTERKLWITRAVNIYNKKALVTEERHNS